jgi:hypothetical protein
VGQARLGERRPTFFFRTDKEGLSAALSHPAIQVFAAESIVAGGPVLSRGQAPNRSGMRSPPARACICADVPVRWHMPIHWHIR